MYIVYFFPVLSPLSKAYVPEGRRDQILAAVHEVEGRSIIIVKLHRSVVVGRASLTLVLIFSLCVSPGSPSPKVEVQLSSNNTLLVTVNGSSLGAGPYSNVSFEWPNNDTSLVRVAFASGITISVQERLATLSVVTSGENQILCFL